MKDGQGKKGNFLSTAVHYFNHDLDATLMTIQTLFLVKDYKNLPLRIKDSIDTFAGTLVNNGMIQNLCDTLIVRFFIIIYIEIY